MAFMEWVKIPTTMEGPSVLFLSVDRILTSKLSSSSFKTNNKQTVSKDARRCREEDQG
jgi:hypothetical protein